MPKYELSHSELPQFRAVLELPEGVQPTSRDLWEGIRGFYRPVALSQFSDEAKLEAYQNGYFEDAPLQPGQPEPPSMVAGITDLFGKAYLSSLSPNSPYKKLMRMHESYAPGIGITSIKPKFDFKAVDGKVKNVITPGIKPVKWRDEENPEDPRFEHQKQYAEAGKILFGLLSTHEDDDKLKDPIGIAIRRAKMPHGFEKDETARGKAYAAALDYSTGNIEAATGEGLTRAMQGGSFIAAGAELLFDKLTLDDDEPDEQWKRAMTLDYVNSKIQFDKINRQYESADELAAFILENPQESVKGAVAGIAGGLTPVLEREDLNELLIDKEDLTMDSQRMQDLKSGYMEPDQGISFLSEITLDPMNLAGAGAAKSLTTFQRAALGGRIKKTLIEAKGLQNARKSLLSSRHADPASSSHSAFRQTLESTTRQLAEKQKILDDYGRNSLLLRAAGKSSPDELLKQAAKQLDTTTDVGRAVSGMVNDAATASTKIGALRKALTKGAYFAPEVAGATIGGAMLGPLGAVAGAAMPAVMKVARILSTWPENAALRYIMRGSASAGEEISEAEAKRRWRSISRTTLGFGTFAGLGYTVATREEGQGGRDVESNLKWLAGSLIGIKSLPALSKLATTAARDLRAIGPELVFARTSEHSPFFNRLSLLPSPDDGLIGATRERFNTLTASTGDGLRDKLLRPLEPIATGLKLAKQAEVPPPGQFRPGIDPKTAPQLSDFSRGAARFLDAKVPELGRGIETLGRFGKTAAAGSSIPAAFGYLASAGEVEGAIAGALVSAPFTSVGAGFGMFENYRTKGDLYQRKIGDLQYYREHLSKDEKVSFDTLPLGDRLAMAGFSLSHPDIVFEGLSPDEMQGRGNYDPETRTIQFNKDTGEGIVEGVLGHEIGHHIAIHGLRPMINKIMFGDSVTGEVGVYGYTDKDGNMVPNDEFVALKNAYQKVLDQDPTITQADKDRYLANEYIAEEIFADNVSDYLGAGRREKDNSRRGKIADYFAGYSKEGRQEKGNSWRGKILDQVFESITGPGFLRDLILKLNVPMDSKGKFLEAGFFHMAGVKVERLPGLQNLIKKYYRDTRGLRKREIEGETVIDPASGRELKKLSKTGVRPVDPEWSESFSWDDMKDPKLVQKLNTGGLFKYQVDKNGKPILDDEGNPKIERDLLGNPKKFTLGELKKLSRIQGDFAVKVLEKYGVKIDETKDGTRVARDFSNLDPQAIDELASGPWHPRQIITLKEIALALREGDGERAGFLLGYFAASKNRKPGPVPFRIRKAVPYGFELTKDGNFLIRLHDVDQLEKNLEFLKGGHKKLPDQFREYYQDLFNSDDNQVWADFHQYRKNTIEGRDGSDGLSDSPEVANKKKNFLNALHGAINDEHVQLNPILRAIDETVQGLPGSNKPRSPFGAATKTFRLDRIFQVERSGNQSSQVNVGRAGKMLMPGGRPKKPGREKRVTGRFSDDLAGRVRQVAEQKGISQNDALIELIEQGLDTPEVTPETAQPTPPVESIQSVESVDPSPNVLTQAEQGILQNPNSSAEYRAAKKKQNEIELQEVEDNVFVKGAKKAIHFLTKKDGGRRFMPSVEQRKASKYGQVFKEAGLNDIELAKAARIKWKDMGDSSPFLQTFLNGETADPPVFAQMKNGEWKPTNLYHVGTLGVAAGKSRNPLEIFNDSPTVKNNEVWAPDSTTILTLDRKKAYDLQRAEDPDQKPLQVITNAKYVFDAKNPEHTKTLDEQLAATAKDEGGDPAYQEFAPSESSSLFAYETELKKLGWHGYHFEEGGVGKVALFDSKRIKLNEDHRGEGKFFSKDRDFGKVSGLFGHRLSADRFSANPQAAKDIRFMPQAEFDFSPPKSKKSEGDTRPNWWKIYRINPEAPDVYDRVADEIIWRGSPEHDGSISEQYSTFLNLDVKKLRPAMTRAHRRYDRGDRRFMPAQDERLQELKDQLEMLGPDPMYRNYPELAKALETVENFLTPDERVEYFGLKVQDRQARQAFERTFGVDPVTKPASARTLARQAGQYEIYDNWKRTVFDPLNKMEGVSVARRKFRTGEAGKQFMPNVEGTHTVRTDKGTEELSARDAMLRPDARDVMYEGKYPMPKDIIDHYPKDSATKTLRKALGEASATTMELISSVWRAISMDDKSFKYVKSGQKDFTKIAEEYGLPVISATRLTMRIGNEDGYILITREGKNRKILNVNSSSADSPGIPHFGQRAYQAILDYAHNNDLIYKGETLTHVNKLRVTTAQLSSALKHESTKHFKITRSQGFTKQEIKDFGYIYDKDIATLALKEAEMSTSDREIYDGRVNLTPLQDLYYDFSTGEFYTQQFGSDNRVPIDSNGIKALIERADPDYKAGVGTTTAKRSAVTRSLIRPPSAPKEAADGGGMGDGGGFLAKGGETEAFTGGSLEKILYMPAAYHGTPHTFKAEEGAPLGKFKSAQIGTGEGAQAYGHGLYFAGKKQVADYYRKELSEKLYDGESYDGANPKNHAAKILDESWDRGSETKEYAREMEIETYKEEVSWAKSKGEDASKMEAIVKVLEEKSESKIKDGGSLYKVELAPKEIEYLLYDKPLGEQPKGVREKMKKLLTELEGAFLRSSREDLWKHRKDQDYRDITNNALEHMSEPEISRRMKEAGIPGIKYLDGSSRSKGKGDYNYVIFDEADVQITEKMFMPASEAGATKGKQAEAAKLWNEKGIESPHFKKWFGKSKVVDENGEPLVVYHGTPKKEAFTEFKKQNRNNETSPHPWNELGLAFFSDNSDISSLYTFEHTWERKQTGSVYPVYLQMKNPRKINYETMFGFERGDVQKIMLDTKAKGHDGFKIERGDGGFDFVPFSPEQIKSATGNRGTFDAGEGNILFMPAVKPLKAAAPTVPNSWVDSTGDVVKGDTIKFTESVFGGSYKKPKYLGDREVIAEVLNDSYGADKQQHTFSLKVISSSGTQNLEAGKTTRRKGRNVYRNGTERLTWEDEKSRKLNLDEKHKRGDAARANRGLRKAGEGNINYMPSDPKAPKRQPVNRLQPQAQSMPANRFMAPAATAGKGELSERFR